MRGLTFACAALLLASLPAGADKVYKWTDEQGQVHYGSLPPPQAAPEELDMRFIDPAGGAPAPADDAPAPAEAAAAPAEATEAPAAPPTPAAAAFAREQCDLGRQRLQVLRDGGPGQRYRKADGSVYRFTGEEYAAELARAERVTQQYCPQAEG
jgi:hypothetical protein